MVSRRQPVPEDELFDSAPSQAIQSRRARAPRLADVIAGDLRQRILSGEIADGDPLPSQERLMKRFEVSQPSIREALRVLEADGLITVRRGKDGGAFTRRRVKSQRERSRRSCSIEKCASKMRVERFKASNPFVVNWRREGVIGAPR